jgi:hypothetical protein
MAYIERTEELIAHQKEEYALRKYHAAWVRSMPRYVPCDSADAVAALLANHGNVPEAVKMVRRWRDRFMQRNATQSKPLSTSTTKEFHMKVTRAPDEFRPVIITIEALPELASLRTMLAEVYEDDSDVHTDDARNTARALLDALNDADAIN